MYCKNCGQQIDDRAVVCPHCGVATGNGQIKTTAADDRPSGGFAVLCFFLPIAGLILYIYWHDNYPQRARSCGKGALIGVIVSVVGTILYVVVFACSAAMLASSVSGYTLIL